LQQITLLADDFALTPAVSAGILALLEHGRLSGTGAMTNRPHWPAFGSILAGIAGVDLGVHLNFTVGAPLGPMPRLAPAGTLPPLPQVALAAAHPGFPRAEWEAEIARQIDAFVAVTGREPDFIDAHQHVHVLPGLRGALLAVLQRRAGSSRPWLRDPFDTLPRILARGVCVSKAQAVAGLATGFARAARAAGCRTNRGFSGFSSFDPKRSFGIDFKRYLVAPGPRHLVMCHPGGIDDELRQLDPVVATRPLEWAYLDSPMCQADLAQAGCRLTRLAQNESAA
jgi:predicted glycoside hydrolase/deacetylase ChbG (UPF0249 family)